MILSFMRHGTAESSGYTDEKRPLAEQGKCEVAAICGGLLVHCGIEAILSSPLVRAKETSEIVRQVLALDSELLVESSFLECGAGLGEMKALLKEHRQFKNLLIVGHAPDLGKITAELLGLELGVQMPTASVIQVKVPFFARGRAELLGFYRPEFFLQS